MRKANLGLAFLVGTIAGCVASRVAVSPAKAGTASARWEYMCVDGWSGIAHSASQLGEEGWEMAAAAGTSDHMMWCFKRPLP